MDEHYKVQLPIYFFYFKEHNRREVIDLMRVKHQMRVDLLQTAHLLSNAATLYNNTLLAVRQLQSVELLHIEIPVTCRVGNSHFNIALM